MLLLLLCTKRLLLLRNNKLGWLLHLRLVLLRLLLLLHGLLLLLHGLHGLGRGRLVKLLRQGRCLGLGLARRCGLLDRVQGLGYLGQNVDDLRLLLRLLLLLGVVIFVGDGLLLQLRCLLDLAAPVLLLVLGLR